MIHELKVENEEQWLEWRQSDVTSTEVAALYGLSPYLTKFELYHRKKEKNLQRRAATEPMMWGNRLEEAIAKAAAEKLGVNAYKANVYIRDDILNAGSSFDYFTENGGIIEVKNVSERSFRERWKMIGDSYSPPLHMQLQIQQQFMLSGRRKGAFAVLVGGNHLEVIEQEPDDEVFDNIKRNIAGFWNDVWNDRTPAPDLESDAEFIHKTLMRNGEGPEIIADRSVEDAVMKYIQITGEISELEKQKEISKADILMKIGDACRVKCIAGTLSCGEIKPNKGKLITQEMVGTYTGARDGYRMFRFTKKKGMNDE